MAIWMIFFGCYLAFIVLFMAIPASLGFSFGIRNLYLATLYKVFEVSLSDVVANRWLMPLENPINLIVLYAQTFLVICKDLSHLTIKVLIAANFCPLS